MRCPRMGRLVWVENVFALLSTPVHPVQRYSRSNEGGKSSQGYLPHRGRIFRLKDDTRSKPSKPRLGSNRCMKDDKGALVCCRSKRTKVRAARSLLRTVCCHAHAEENVQGKHCWQPTEAGDSPRGSSLIFPWKRVPLRLKN